MPEESVRVLVVGAGFGGLAAAAHLRAVGYRSPDDLLIIEKADEVGGTWRDNTYPECACDVQSVLYSFSFAPNPDWPRSYGRQPEILDYLARTVRETGLIDHIRFGCELLFTWRYRQATRRLDLDSYHLKAVPANALTRR